MGFDWKQLLREVEAAKWVEWTTLGVRFVLILLVAWGLLYVVKAGITRIGMRLQAKAATRGERKRVETLMRVFKYVANIVIMLMGILAALNTIGISIAPMLAAAGVVGIAVGFGAQSLVKDYFTGIVLLIENQIRVGDVVCLDNRTGNVEEVTLRYVRLRDAEGNVHFVPNGQITAVTNMSMGFSYAIIDVSVDYKEDVQKVIGLMDSIGKSMLNEDPWKSQLMDEFLVMGVQTLADSAVVIRCRFKTVGGEQWAIRREYFRRVKDAFDREKVEIPYPQMVMHKAMD
jgi:moderate conductance mechanosensitive channel